MFYKKLIILLLILAVASTSLFAGNERRIGTAGAPELRIPIGARGTAMGGAITANTYGLESIHWNPAGLANIGGTEILFSHQPYLVDVNINFVGIGRYFEGMGVLAFGAKIVSVGDMEETTDEFPDGTGRIFSPTLSVFSLSYASNLTDRVQFGATGKFIYENIFEASASGVAFDIGFIYNPRWKGLTLGINIKNYGPDMRFAGNGFQRSLDGRQGSAQSGKFDLPSSFELGMDYEFVNQADNRFSVSGNFRSNNYSSDLWQSGLEYTYKSRFSLRLGYNYADQKDWLYGFSAGAGVELEWGESLLSFDYAWTDTDIFDNNQYFTFGIKF